jgi:hypothetical protein
LKEPGAVSVRDSIEMLRAEMFYGTSPDTKEKRKRACDRCPKFCGCRRGQQGEQQTTLEMMIDCVPFHMGMSVILVLNAIFILIEQTQRTDANYSDDVWLIFEIAFTVVFSLEFGIKFVALRCSYFHSAWNDFDFFLLLLSYFGLVMELYAV